MNKIKISLLALAAGITISSCAIDSDILPKEPFVITDYYVAGTLTPASNSYTSVYLIKLLENNKAVFMSSGSDFTGDYTLTEDSLVVIVSDPNNYREARFAINKDHELTSARYKALTTEYKTTGSLLKIGDKNLLAGKTFKGEEFKMGPSSFKSNWFYKFNETGYSYGKGEDAAAISTEYEATIINNSAFKFKNSSFTEIGFVQGDSLTIFRSQGLYYFGKYKKQ